MSEFESVLMDEEEHKTDILKNNPWIENLFEGVYSVDVDRKILYWNQGAETITGYKSDEIIRRSCFDNILNHVNEDGVGLALTDARLRLPLKMARSAKPLFIYSINPATESR